MLVSISKIFFFDFGTMDIVGQIRPWWAWRRLCALRDIQQHPGLHPWDASSTALHLRQSKLSPDILECLLEGKIAPLGTAFSLKHTTFIHGV